MYDVLIIGAGIEGTAIARRLSRYALSIALVEAANDVAMGSTKANSAIVHGGYAEANAKLKGRVCYKGRVQFAQLDKELNFGFRETGSLVITTNEEDLPKLEALLENGKLNGLDDLSILNHDEIMELEPNINPEVKYALYCKGAGVCSPYEMAIALAENAIHNGAELFLTFGIVANFRDVLKGRRLELEDRLKDLARRHAGRMKLDVARLRLALLILVV